MGIKKQKLMFFDNLIHMGFIAKLCPNSKKLVITDINNQLKRRLFDLEFEVEEIDKDNVIFEDIVRQIFHDEHFIDEYLSLTSLLSFEKKEEAETIDLTHFVLSDVSSVEKDIFSIKSVSPEGILTKVIPFDYYKDDSAIYVDVFTVPQFDGKRKKIIGIQGIFPIANVRRSAFLKSKKDSELNIFHNLIADMPNRSTSIIRNIIEDSKDLTDNTRYRLTAVADYLESLFEQSKKTLELFSDITFNDNKVGHTPVVELKNHVESLQNSENHNLVPIDIKFDSRLTEAKSLLSVEGFDFILSQTLDNADTQYRAQKTKKKNRLITISLSEVRHENRDVLELSILTHNLRISEKVINNAGIRPLSTQSTGLGFYFMNTVLELLKANLPLTNKKRHFDLFSPPEGVLFNIYFYLR